MVHFKLQVQDMVFEPCREFVDWCTHYSSSNIIYFYFESLNISVRDYVIT